MAPASKYNEESLVERPVIEYLLSLGYSYLPVNEHQLYREDEFAVVLKEIFIRKVKELNSLNDANASKMHMDLLRLTDNEECINKLRGNYSMTVGGKKHRQTIKFFDFDNPNNNEFTVLNQFKVKGLTNRKPDIVIFVNGIPLVVIECKSPIANQDIYSGIHQIHTYEKQIPKLFVPNIFNISTDGKELLYGATGTPAKYYLEWKDPWPHKVSEFADRVSLGIFSLLQPKRLLDILRHFIIFEVRDNVKTKKICRYQQYRATNKIVQRVVESKLKRGLIWHTQGSGKSLTMVFTAMKLKLTKSLNNPNILLLTDRTDLDDQISGTFLATGFRNPKQVNSIRELKQELNLNSHGQTLMSTIHKFQEFDDSEVVDNSQNFIIFVDEAHRTQEGDLGAKFRRALPDAFYFGFTGTPIKKTDRNTYINFGVAGEDYLDRYAMEDAEADGVTVPIFYESKMVKWHMEGAKLDILFDQWFKDLPDDKREQLKQKQCNVGTLVKAKSRIELLAYDIATHFKTHVEPDGYKAQLVAFDRETIVLYKRELDKYFKAKVANGLDEVECVYSASQHDEGDLVIYYADEKKEKDIKNHFKRKDGVVKIVIVCDKLLTGFDAPIEQAMYLDSPLKEHNLLQAIARTNRAYENKVNGLIVDYFGISEHLSEALASYRKKDVQNAMRDIKELKQLLKHANAELMAMFRSVKRHSDPKEDITSAMTVIDTEDKWYIFKKRLKTFSTLYNSISPDPYVLNFSEDLKWAAVILSYGMLKFESKEHFDFKEYGEKVRNLVNEHLVAKGIVNLVKLKNLSDPDFFKEEIAPYGDSAALKKAESIRKTLRIKLKENPIAYHQFSEMLEKLIEDYNAGRIQTAEVLKKYDELARKINDQQNDEEKDSFGKNINSFLKLLKLYVPKDSQVNKADLKEKAEEIHEIFETNENACFEWQKKEGSIRELTKLVKRSVIGLVQDRDQFAQKVIEYSKVNYYKG
ncbi:HsdR family type I site-specific deoxyribonuclease [Desulfosporosinus burensis]